MLQGIRLTRLAAALAACVLPASAAHATWSVAAAEPQTRRVAIATATCVSQSVFAGSRFRGLTDIQAVVAPGAGVAAAQAESDPTGADQALVAEALRKGTAPADIVRLLQAKGAAAGKRQFGIVDVRGRAAAFSGDAIPAEAAARQGRAGGGRFAYAVQGNTLRSEAVVADAARAFEATPGGLAERVLAALYAGDLAGGDRRCSCAVAPLPKQPCVRRNALIAYLIVAGPHDAANADGHPPAFDTFIYVTDQNTLPTESADPVETLRKRFEASGAGRGKQADGA